MSASMPAMPAGWTPIAERARSIAVAGEKLTWSQAVNPVMTIEAAQELAARGEIVLASRHDADRIVLLVRPSARRQRRTDLGSGM